MPILSNRPLAVPINETFILNTDNLDYYLLLGKLEKVQSKITSLDWLTDKLKGISDFNQYKKYVSIKGVLQNRFSIQVLNAVDQETVFLRLRTLFSTIPEVTVTKGVLNGNYYVYLWSDSKDLFLNIQTQINEILNDINPNYVLEIDNFIVNDNPSNTNGVFDILTQERNNLVELYSNLCEQLLLTPLTYG
jgi:hypothetical protein